MTDNDAPEHNGSHSMAGTVKVHYLGLKVKLVSPIYSMFSCL